LKSERQFVVGIALTIYWFVVQIVTASMLCRRTIAPAWRISVRGLAYEANQNKDESRLQYERMLRVDHAGEYGAVRIYQGQLAVLGKTSIGETLEEFLEQEKEHLAKFESILPAERVRPTALLPLWDVAGFALGAGTALLGKEAAMACTVAVETVIGGHYNSQIRMLMEDGEDGKERHKELLQTISKFRDDELEHLDTAIEEDAEQAPMYEAMSGVIKAGCYAAIWMSERV